MSARVEPKLDVSKLPKHEVERFESFTEISSGNKKGFVLEDGQMFFFDSDGGWVDQSGCYYDKDGKPAGWLVQGEDKESNEHFYDLEGNYVLSGEDSYYDSSDYDSRDNEINDLSEYDLSEYGQRDFQSEMYYESRKVTLKPNKENVVLKQTEQKGAPQKKQEQPKPGQSLNYKFLLVNSKPEDVEIDLKLLQSFLSGRDSNKNITEFMGYKLKSTLNLKSSQIIEGFKSLNKEFEYFPQKIAKPIK